MFALNSILNFLDSRFMTIQIGIFAIIIFWGIFNIIFATVYKEEDPEIIKKLNLIILIVIIAWTVIAFAYIWYTNSVNSNLDSFVIRGILAFDSFITEIAVFWVIQAGERYFSAVKSQR